MAITKTYNLTANNGDVYADTAAWVAAHGLCGTENLEFVTEGTMTLLDGGNGVQVVLEYPDQATLDAHEATFADDKAGDTAVTRTAV